MTHRRRRVRSLLVAGLLALAGTGIALEAPRASLPTVTRIVLQKGQRYLPTDLYLRRGDTIALRNGDARLTHHAFIEADRFSFDAGDQAPGTETHLTLAERGDFVIQCGIHPKMKLVIHVE
jgi:plastocyanin